MLKVNVGLSRKLSREFNSSGFTINLEGEVSASLHNPEKLLANIQEYYDLAEEALQRQIEHHTARPLHSDVKQTLSSPQLTMSPPSVPTEPEISASVTEQVADPATKKQIQYLLNLGKRQGLNPSQLQGRITQILGLSVELYSLTKAQAGQVLNALMKSYTDSTATPRKVTV
jgi:hypothetical protein